jgi:hypothetical protein
LLVAAMPRKMVEVRSAPMTVDLMSMFFMVLKSYHPEPEYPASINGNQLGNSGRPHRA